MTEKNDTSADVRDALRAAGIAEAALATAEAEFRPEYAGNSLNKDGDWRLAGSVTTLAKHAARYAAAHPFLCEDGQAPPDNPDDKYYPRYADGTRVPPEQIDADDWFRIQGQIDADKAAEARGPEPEPQPMAERRVAASEALKRKAAAAQRAERERRGGAGDGHQSADLPPGVLPEFRSHYSTETTIDEDFEAAGDGADLPGYVNAGDYSDYGRKP